MRTLLVLSLAMLLSACTLAEWHSINRKFDPTDGDSRLIDAKQRAIISVKRNVITAGGRQAIGDNNRPLTDLTVCTEPSPDALQATAVALAGTGSAKALEAALSLSGSSSESAASIGLRTQTIQLLRDAYFRLCEAFLNDGIDAIAYDILQRRFQNQVIALLAVEQLTGPVKTDQVGLNTSATGTASAPTGLLTQTLLTFGEERRRLREKQAANETELQKLKNKKLELEKFEKTAVAARDKDETTKQDPALKEEAEQAKKDLESNAEKIEAAEKQKETLERKIAQKNQQVETLTEAVVKAVNVPTASNASGHTVFGSSGTTPSSSHTSEVVNAVRAITLNAINQDYEAQVCFEALRYRNNVGQFKNEVNQVFTRSGHRTQVEMEKQAFVEYCTDLFKAQVKLRGARVDLITVQVKAVGEIIRQVGQGKISAHEAVNLITALSHAAPMEPGAAFLSRRLNINPSSDTKDPKPGEMESEHYK